MDPEAIARNQRRRVIGDALESELGTEAALREQLEETVAEIEGPRIDEETLARLAFDDAEIVRDVLGSQIPGGVVGEDADEDWFTEEVDPEAERQELLAEIARLEEEIARSQRRREALQRYVDALDG